MTVVIPTRANGRGLDRAIASVREQRDQPPRVLVVVDGTDESTADEDTLRGLAAPDCVIRVSPLGSPAKMRNIGLDAVETTLVAFLDDDDWWEPDKLRIQLHAMESSQSLVVASNAFIVDDGEVVGAYHASVPASVGFDQLLETNWLITSSVLTNAHALRALGGFPVGAPVRGLEDYVAWLKLAAIGDVHVVRAPLVYYTAGRTDSISRETPSSGVEARARALQELADGARWWLQLTRRRRTALARLAGA